jgi:dTMP kinase
MSPLSELFLFNASRAQLVADVIRPHLEGGTVVVCDRYTDSTLAYQGYGRGLDLATVRRANDAAAGGLVPDLTMLLDIPVERAFARKAGDGLDRFETENVAFHERVRRGYLEMAAAEPGRWLVVDALLSKRQIGDVVWRRVRQLLNAGANGSG